MSGPGAVVRRPRRQPGASERRRVRGRVYLPPGDQQPELRDLLPPLHAFAAHFRAPVLEVLHCAHKGARDWEARLLQTLGLSTPLDKHVQHCTRGGGGNSVVARNDEDSSDGRDASESDTTAGNEDSEYSSGDCAEADLAVAQRGRAEAWRQRSADGAAYSSRQPAQSSRPQQARALTEEQDDGVAQHWYGLTRSLFRHHSDAIMAACGKDEADRAVVHTLACQAVAAAGVDVEAGPAVRGWLALELLRLADAQVMQTGGNTCGSYHAEWPAAAKEQAVSSLLHTGGRGRREASDLVAAAAAADVHVRWIQQVLLGLDWLAPARERPPVSLPSPPRAAAGVAASLDAATERVGEEEAGAGRQPEEDRDPQDATGLKRRGGGGGGGRGGAAGSKMANLILLVPVLLVGAASKYSPLDAGAATPRAPLPPRARNCAVSLHASGGRMAGAGR
ncbi:hypothetical protein CHLRE_16g658250v5 [Chlamydomonas reinhardtii]|uniref:Uncharacterized protein n=1 Tax=Chlamydomonas reinhardtii TaxID=3055 RepID=A0A2K3CTC2_CHLRE|nr:uncharacterized protein CHLRE_16g658250v5 [Chlamydomonas reinhardtii]PNW71532.1 hypothetical protein CHLRE_16g658250v5 [Chlamydomonas reinhardtii]